MPGSKEASVHLTDLPRLPEVGVDVTAWDRLFALREMVAKVLERARAAGQIGQSLEADIALHGNFSPKALIGDLDVDLAKFFIVSHVDFRPPAEVGGDVVDIPGVGTIAVTMSPARGRKCGRCWQYREEVAQEGGLCARCEDVIDGLAPAEAGKERPVEGLLFGAPEHRPQGGAVLRLKFAHSFVPAVCSVFSQ